MSRASERLIEHVDGSGRLLGTGDSSLAVHYVLDTWAENIPTGSGTWTEMQSHDGVLWWEGRGFPQKTCTLETENGREFQVSLFEFRSQRARFHCV